MAPDVTTGDNDESTNGLNVLEDDFETLNSADTLNYSNVILIVNIMSLTIYMKVDLLNIFSTKHYIGI